MSTVDFESLARAVQAVGAVCSEVECSYEGELLMSIAPMEGSDPILNVNQFGAVGIEKSTWNLADHWGLLDIIRRHLDPPVARPDLRERCAKAALDAACYHPDDGGSWVDSDRIPLGDWADDWECEPIQWDYAQDEWRDEGRRIADAVLRVIAGGDE